MKQKLSQLFALFSLFLIFSCSKSGSGDSSAPKMISITSVSPDKLYNGTQVTVTGENFGTDTSKLYCRLNNQKMTIAALTNTSLTFTIPQNFVQSQQTCSLELELNSVLVSRNVTISFVEPHGWFYAATLPLTGTSLVYKELIFPTDSIGYALREKSLYMTTDGGITWKGDNNNGGLGLGYAIASSDGKNVWVESVADLFVGSNGINTWTVPTGASYNSVITGLYTTAPANGLVALECGKLYDINGSFAGAVLKYQSSLYVNDRTNLWQKMSALDKNNLIIAGYSNKIVLEKAGVFSEGDISAVSSVSGIKDLQMVDANTIFLVNSADELIKYSGNTWAKLTQPANAVYFINTTTGYIAYNGKILKTTDGGASFKEEFTLKGTEKVNAICVRNGKIWALGSDGTQGFVVKYNP